MTLIFDLQDYIIIGLSILKNICVNRFIVLISWQEPEIINKYINNTSRKIMTCCHINWPLAFKLFDPYCDHQFILQRIFAWYPHGVADEIRTLWVVLQSISIQYFVVRLEVPAVACAAWADASFMGHHRKYHKTCCRVTITIIQVNASYVYCHMVSAHRKKSSRVINISTISTKAPSYPPNRI